MKVTLPSDTKPRFSQEQLDYLKKRFEFRLCATTGYTLEDIAVAQGRLQVLHHIQNLIDSQ